jgi:mannose-6-phosphate isomerase-like protein (cupin superfamily)
MQPFHDAVDKAARSNTDFRRVLYTGSHVQLVLMCLRSGEDIGMETHEDVDQALTFVEGSAQAILNDVGSPCEAGDVVIVPAGTKHNFINTGSTDLKLYTFYAPPEHKDGIVRHTKDEAMTMPE